MEATLRRQDDLDSIERLAVRPIDRIHVSSKPGDERDKVMAHLFFQGTNDLVRAAFGREEIDRIAQAFIGSGQTTRRIAFGALCDNRNQEPDDLDDMEPTPIELSFFRALSLVGIIPPDTVDGDPTEVGRVSFWNAERNRAQLGSRVWNGWQEMVFEEEPADGNAEEPVDGNARMRFAPLLAIVVFIAGGVGGMWLWNRNRSA